MTAADRAAEPAPLPPLDPARTALVLIDLQRGIVAMPTVPTPASEVVANASRLARACRAAGAQVVLVRVTPSADRRDALQPPADAPSPGGARPANAGAGGPAAAGSPPADFAEIVPEVGPEPGDIVITKRQWGAFYGTELDLQLRRRGVTTIILGGISTDIGVESTARGAYERGYAQVFASNAMAARSAAGHAHAVGEILPRIGRVRPVDEIIAAVGRGAAGDSPAG
jgi:nicotinamidase-related amidase